MKRTHGWFLWWAKFAYLLVQFADWESAGLMTMVSIFGWRLVSASADDLPVDDAYTVCDTRRPVM